MTSENQKSPFMVVVKVTTYTETGHPRGITEWNVRADTINVLRSEVDKFRAMFNYQNEESGGKMTIAFGPELELNMETGKYSPMEQEVEAKRGIFSKLLEDILPILPSSFTRDKE